LQLRRVVVGVDFTDASLAAARWAASHFAPGAEVVLVHVAPGAGVPSFVRADLPSPPEIAAAVAPALYGALRGLAEFVDRDRTRVELVIGNPAEALAGLADEITADVICVGRGRRRRGGARFGATTPQRLLLRTRVPTLVVPASAPETPTRVVLGVDEHSGEGDVVEQAFRLAAALEASVDLLHVIAPGVEHLVSGMRKAVDPMGGVSGPLALRALGEVGDGNERDWLQDRARTWVHALMEDAGSSAARSTPVIRWGDPGSEIIRHARRGAADLIIIGRGGGAAQPCLPGTLLPLGSTARLVTWAAPCPVLVLPLQVSPGVVPRPPAREPGQRTKANVIALRSAQNGPSRPLPPAARHERSVGEEGAA
jgi:nucleotide-binding universal stress UspA family protein